MVQINILLVQNTEISIVQLLLKKSYSQKEIISKLKISKATAVKYLKKLVEKKVVSYKNIGPTKIYSVDIIPKFIPNKHALKVLSVLDREMTQIQIRERTKLAKATLVETMKVFEKEKLVKVRKIGPAKLYSLEENHE